MEKYSLTSMQRQIYYYQKMYPNDPSYNLNTVLMLEGDIDVNKLTSVLEDIFNTQIYKMVFGEFQGEIYQCLNKHRRVTPQVIELKENITTNELIKLVSEDANKPFDINAWPLINLKVYVSRKKVYLHIKRHHIITDVTSMLNEMKAISARYNGEKHSVITDNFLDYINNMDDAIEDNATDYFKGQFAETERFSLEELHEDRDKEGICAGVHKYFLIDKQKVDTLCDNLKVTPFLLNLCLYAFVLSILSREKKVIIGIPVANRKSEYKYSSGIFINAFPVMLDFSGYTIFGDLVEDVKKKITTIKKFQSYPFKDNIDKIYGGNNIPKDFYNNSITYWKAPVTLTLNNVKVTSLDFLIKEKAIKFPLSVTIENVRKKYMFRMEYAKKYKEVDFKKIFNTLLNEIYYELPLNDLLLSSNDPELESCNRKMNKSEANQDKTMIAMLKDISSRYPDKVAIKSKKSEITYRDLWYKSNYIANYLYSNIKEENIILSLEPSINLIIYIIGILKSGKCYIPLDISMPLNRKNNIIQQLHNAVIITDKHHFDEYSKVEFPTLSIEDISKTAKNGNNINNSILDGIAYMIFTSGSTGIPKGVKILHRNILSLFLAAQKSFNFEPNLTWILFHSYGFDYSIWEIFGALLTGAKLIVIPKEVKKSPDLFRKMIIDEKITVLTQTPSAFVNLIKVDARKEEKDLDFVKYVFVGGESVSFSQFKKWTDKYGLEKPMIYNLYGITETSVVSTYHRVDETDIIQEKSNIIGQALANTNFYISDIYGNPLPIGLSGELKIYGEAVGSGYYRNEKQTQQRFIPGNRFSQYQTIFCTGDLVRLNENNELVYLNRIDNQVQINGHRVELGEIENAIKNFSGCEQVAVIAHEFNESDTRIIAYCVLDSYATKDQLFAYLKNILPKYMIPSFIEIVDELKMNVNGKIDKKSLIIPTISDVASGDADYTEDGTLQKIIKKKKKVLNVELIHKDDNFFDVGGTSFLLTEVYIELLDAFKLTENDLSTTDLFDYTTPNEIAEYINEII